MYSNNRKMPTEEEEPASPSARLMQAKEFNLCIIAVIGYNSSVDPILYKKNLHQTLLKHPRFSSLLIKNKGKCSWKRTKNVNIDNHVTIVPDLDPNMESSDKFVEDFASDLSKIPMDMTKPLWEIHILNVKTSDAKAITVFKIHHSMGDGVSLIALCHACSRNTSDPQSLPVMPFSKKQTHVSDHRGFIMRFFVLVWTIFRVTINTIVDCVMLLATIVFLKDGDTPIKAAGGSVLSYKRFVHRIVNFDDVKLVKNVMNMTINDVLVGATEAGLSRYLNARYEKHTENGEKIMKKSTNSLPRNLRLRSAVLFNLRPSPTIENLVEMMEKEELSGMWGNKIGFVLLSFNNNISLQHDDPLAYIRRAKSNMDRKKLSLGHKSAFLVMKLIMFLLGPEIAAGVTRTILKNTTLLFSNVKGPQEEIHLFGHPLSYIAPSVYGLPQSLVVHYQSYAGKLIISIGADEKLIPNPHQLCDDFVKSLGDIKEAVIKRELVSASHFC